MIETRHLKIRQPSDVYIFEYEEPAEFAKQQRGIFWTPEEINVEADKQDFLVNMSPAEQHAIKTTLKLFTIYELLLNEAWGSRIYQDFPRPEIQMMASTFAFMESSVHAVFYSNLNKALMIDTEEFYSSYKNDPILSQRIKSINEAIASKDLLKAIAAFTLLENVVLYSNFAFIKHYQSNGKTMLQNVVSGINFSARDENLHALGAAWLFNTTLAEYRALVPGHEGVELKVAQLHAEIYEFAKDIYEHECRIVDMLFSEGDIEGIKADDIKTFIADRVNMTLDNLNLLPIFTVEENPIADWFYPSINGTQFHDFFQVSGNEYNRNWNFDSVNFEGGF